MASSSSQASTIDLPLYKAALKGDWKSASRIIEENPKAAKAEIMGSTHALHVAVGTKKSNEFVKNLLEKMSPEEVASLTDKGGQTAVTIAAVVGNTDAVKLLVDKNPAIPNIQGMDGSFPIHNAADFGHREVVMYLLKVTKADVHPSPYKDDSGALLLRQLILAGFYDLAADLVEENKELAILEGSSIESPLCCIIIMQSTFFSRSEWTLWDRLIYSCVPLTLSSKNVANDSGRGDIENPANTSKAPIWSWFQHFKGINLGPKLLIALWKVIESLVPRAKHIREMKSMHGKALGLVELLCTQAASLDNSSADKIFSRPVFLAAQYGAYEIVEKIIESFPLVVQYMDRDKRNIFQLAVMNRHHEVFNLISRISHEHKHIVSKHTDRDRNSILHLVGHLAPSDQLNRISGAALQMQRELQWFKEVEKLVPSFYRHSINNKGDTARMVFTEEHKELVKEGERWMKDTANSCSVVAALIATVVFAAAITVPGGTNGDNGLPVFKSQKAFIIFAVSDALSLFSSTAAILMFLSILTARYAEDDFLQSLPKRLIMGLLTLFISISTMMIAFSSTLYLVFGDDKTWILILVAASACLLVTLFVYLQFPLLVDMFRSTYGKGLFGNRSEEPLY